MKKRETSCGVIPFLRDGSAFKFLIIKQQVGHWCFPKGHVEPGETESETAQREFQEELGIMPKHLFSEHRYQENYTFSQDGEEIDKTVIYFLGELSKQSIEEIVLQEAEVAEFFVGTYEETLTRLTHNDPKVILKNVYEQLQHGV
ncbi:MAG: NUDIX hydrolase [candidate division SR1 bacterium]|nr:MAG: NUDIX hydrolase [candidate division SR1 bacterium]